MGSIGDSERSGMLGYRISKAAVNMVGKNLSIEWTAEQIMVLLLHPGYVRTDMTGGNGLINPDESARGLFTLMQNKTMADTGTFWHTNGTPIEW
jgi:NAD(P)-dependent dehydrogenase (short-subunit alcohol dehydrogenase family)